MPTRSRLDPARRSLADREGLRAFAEIKGTHTQQEPQWLTTAPIRQS